MGLTLDAGITTVHGKVFNFDRPEDTEPLDITDIAIPLGNVCRFAGQLDEFYSVAQHCVNVSMIVPAELAFTALMHDTAEAFTNDIVTPLKHKVPVFKELETRIEAEMAKRFGFQYPFPEEIHTADRQMLGLEMVYLRGMNAADWHHLDGYEFEHLKPLVDLTPWTPKMARRNFLMRYKELIN